MEKDQDSRTHIQTLSFPKNLGNKSLVQALLQTGSPPSCSGPKPYSLRVGTRRGIATCQLGRGGASTERGPHRSWQCHGEDGYEELWWVEVEGWFHRLGDDGNG